MNLSDLRKQQYQHNEETYPFITDWKRNPYTNLKYRLHMEAGAILVYFLLKTNIRPNTITWVYIFSGIIGGILLAIPINTLIYISIFIFSILRITLDTADGHLARIRNQESLRGGFLDDYGGYINSLCFWTGLGFYVFHFSGLIIFYYLIPLLLFFFAADMYFFIGLQIIQEVVINRKQVLNKLNENRIHTSAHSNYKIIRAMQYIFESISNFLRDSFPDDRSRTVDLVCLLIILELNGGISLSWIIFLLFFIKKFILFIYSIYAIVNKNWAEQIIQKIWNDSV